MSPYVQKVKTYKTRIQLPFLFFFLLMTTLLTACGSSPLEVTRGLLGYTPPPKETTVSEELQLEYERCLKIGIKENCAQAAYDVVRKVKGLEPRPIPEGYIIILQESLKDKSKTKGDNK